jgi:DNA-binding transcriptional LysR family regulator
MLSVTPRRLEVFVKVVEAEGFGAAAAALDISQPSVSSHMRALEGLVGADLFERRPGMSPQLTDAGRTLYVYAKETIERATAIAAKLGHTTRTLRFAAQRVVATSLLAKPLENFSATFPRIELVVRTGMFEEVHALFTSGAVDLVFLLSPGDVPGLQTTPMGRYRMAFIASPSHPLAKAQRISAATLATYPFISAYRGSYFGRTVETMLRDAGIPPLIIGSQAQEIGMVRDMVIANMGISCSLRRSVQKDLADGTLVELDVDLDPMHLVLSYARSPRAVMPEIDSLVDMVRMAEGQTG